MYSSHSRLNKGLTEFLICFLIIIGVVSNLATSSLFRSICILSIFSIITVDVIKYLIWGD